MASPEKIVPLLPDTLPEDFSEWDGEGFPVQSVGHSSEWEAWDTPHSLGKSAKALDPSDGHDAMLPPVVEMPPAPRSAAPAPAAVKPQRDLTDWDREALSAPSSATPSAATAAPAPTPISRNEWEELEAPHSFESSAVPLKQADDRDAMLPPAVEKQPAPRSAEPAPVVGKQQRDLTEWDREVSSASLLAPTSAPTPINRDEWEALEAPHSIARNGKPNGHTADHDAILPPVANKPVVSGPAPNTSVFAKPQKEPVDQHSEAYPAPIPTSASRNEWEAFEAPHSTGKSQKPLAYSADHVAKPSPVVDKPRVSASASPATTTPTPQKSASALVDVPPSRPSRPSDGGYPTSAVPKAQIRPSAATASNTRNAAEPAAAVSAEVVEGRFPAFRSLDADAAGEKAAAKKKWMMIAAISVCSMLLVLTLIGLILGHGTKSAAKPEVQPQPVVAETQTDTDTPAPLASAPSTEKKPPAATATQQTTVAQPAEQENAAKSTPAQSQMMHDQLTAPLKISVDAKKQIADNGPPPESLGAAGVDGLGGSDAGNSDLNGRAGHTVKVVAAKPVAISSGVATGMLIQRTPPNYPPIAKSARVSGTVVLEATIAKNGTIKDLHVVNGPAMLRQAAVEAVQNWRYKPYKLNNEPTEVETTINVVFSLGS